MGDMTMWRRTGPMDISTAAAIMLTGLFAYVSVADLDRLLRLQWHAPAVDSRRRILSGRHDPRYRGLVRRLVMPRAIHSAARSVVPCVV